MENTENGFSSLGLSEKTLEALEKKGFVEPTEIQKLCIPLLLEENTEVIGQAQTGTGKTAAFGLPIIEKIDGGQKEVQALILCPTRELAIQVADEIDSLKGDRNIVIVPIYGGASMENQLKRLRNGVDVIVGTPGRILDHLRRKTLKLDDLKFAVLDEADEMLDMGFIEDIEAILEETPAEKRMLMFSATMPKEIQKIAERFMKNYQLIRTEKKDTSNTNTHQVYYEVRENDKIEALSRILDKEVGFYGVIFCRTKLQCDEIGNTLITRGYEAAALHGDLSQREREVILKKMREKRISILVATDVASRGLDIQELTHVINFSIPEDPEVYIHRVGRTGRAGKEGTAITFVTPREMRKFAYILRTTSSNAEKLSIPSPEDVIDCKKQKIVEEGKAIVSAGPDDEYMKLAFDILESKDAFMAFASLLQHTYKGALDPRQYKPIKGFERKEEKKNREKAATSDRKERKHFDRDASPETMTRLFVARGRKDGLTKRGLANILIDQVGVRDDELVDIEVMDDFSFLNTNEVSARLILEYFAVPKGQGKPLVTRANVEKKDSCGSKKEKKRRNRENERPEFPRKKKQHRAWMDDIQPYGRDTYGDDDDGKFRMPDKRERSYRNRKGRKKGRK